MKGLKIENVRTCQNIMEILVSREVQKQLRQLPPNLAGYIDPVEVATFALNRLPPLYASSTQGKQAQQKKAEQQLKNQITIAVRQAIAAVQRDPIRHSDPIASEQSPEYIVAIEALKQLELFLHRRNLTEDELTWDNLVPVIRNSMRIYASNLNARNEIPPQRQPEPEPEPEPEMDNYSAYDDYNNYDDYTSPSAEYDWGDRRYH